MKIYDHSDVLQAFKEGFPVQYYNYDDNFCGWVDCLCDPKWDDRTFRAIVHGVCVYSREVTEEVKPALTNIKMKAPAKHAHYFKPVPYSEIDIYRVHALFEVDDPSGALQHASKKILMAGKRGGKDRYKDICEARDTLQRKIDMLDEEAEHAEIKAEAACTGK